MKGTALRQKSKLITVCDKVVARFRPPNKTELASGGETIVNFETEDTCNINVCIPTKQEQITGY